MGAGFLLQFQFGWTCPMCSKKNVFVPKELDLDEEGFMNTATNWRRFRYGELIAAALVPEGVACEKCKARFRMGDAGRFDPEEPSD